MTLSHQLGIGDVVLVSCYSLVVELALVTLVNPSLRRSLYWCRIWDDVVYLLQPYILYCT